MRMNSRFLFATFAGLALIGACAVEALDESSIQSNVTSGNVVTQWADIARDACSRPVEASRALSTPAVAYTQMAMTQLAVYDTMNALHHHEFAPFLFTGNAHGHPNQEAAVATAAYRVLRTRIPGRAAFLDTQYSNYIA